MGVPLPPRLAQLFPDRRQMEHGAAMARMAMAQGGGMPGAPGMPPGAPGQGPGQNPWR